MYHLCGAPIVGRGELDHRWVRERRPLDTLRSEPRIPEPAPTAPKHLWYLVCVFDLVGP